MNRSNLGMLKVNDKYFEVISILKSHKVFLVRDNERFYIVKQSYDKMSIHYLEKEYYMQLKLIELINHKTTDDLENYYRKGKSYINTMIDSQMFDNNHLIVQYLFKGDFLPNYVYQIKNNKYLKAVIKVKLCYAVQFLHTNHILHLDLKPENIVTNGIKDFAIIDFESSLNHSNRKYNMPFGNNITTPTFCAPELLIEKRANKSSDIYSLGLVFYYIDNGFSLFKFNTLYEANKYYLTKTKVITHSDLITRMIDIDPVDRPKLKEITKTCEAEVVQMLEEICSSIIYSENPLTNLLQFLEEFMNIIPLPFIENRIIALKAIGNLYKSIESSNSSTKLIEYLDKYDFESMDKNDVNYQTLVCEISFDLFGMFRKLKPREANQYDVKKFKEEIFVLYYAIFNSRLKRNIIK